MSWINIFFNKTISYLVKYWSKYCYKGILQMYLKSRSVDFKTVRLSDGPDPWNESFKAEFSSDGPRRGIQIFEVWESFIALLLLLRWWRPCDKEWGWSLRFERSPWMATSRETRTTVPPPQETEFCQQWVWRWIFSICLQMRTQLSWHLSIFKCIWEIWNYSNLNYEFNLPQGDF